MAYDDDNIFAKIVRGELPCDAVFENEHALAFRDINPLMPVHILVIPKGRYVSMNDFADNASAAEALCLVQAMGEVAKIAGVEDSGYRLLANNGPQANQEVPHLHFHVFGGRQIRGRMVRAED